MEETTLSIFFIHSFFIFSHNKKFASLLTLNKNNRIIYGTIYILMMVIKKYFYYRDRDLKGAGSLIINSQKYFTGLSHRLASGDVV